jgi:hypothetical protein
MIHVAFIQIHPGDGTLPTSAVPLGSDRIIYECVLRRCDVYDISETEERACFSCPMLEEGLRTGRGQMER